MKYGDIIEIAMFLTLIATCLFASFTALHRSRVDIIEMNSSNADTRHIRERDSSSIQHSYLGRQGAYLNAGELAMAIGTASADGRAKICLFGQEFDTYDMYSQNIEYMTEIVPLVYAELDKWWQGFEQSPDYSAFEFASDDRVYEYDNPNKGSGRHFILNYNNETFAGPGETVVEAKNEVLNGFLFRNPTSLDDCKFKLQVVEAGSTIRVRAAAIEGWDDYGNPIWNENKLVVFEGPGRERDWTDGADGVVSAISPNYEQASIWYKPPDEFLWVWNYELEEYEAFVQEREWVQITGELVSVEPILEYRVFVFLGYLTRYSDNPMEIPSIEYRWFECILGDWPEFTRGRDGLWYMQGKDGFTGTNPKPSEQAEYLSWVLIEDLLISDLG